ncbi:MAG: hypothetical protein IKQ87_00975, partial [Clostridia bacterium]|nr:hypothetical protein [Clostridia bacterium]
NEEGLIRDLPVNRFMNYDFRGDFFLCGVRGEEFSDVPEALIRLAFPPDEDWASGVGQAFSPD